MRRTAARLCAIALCATVAGMLPALPAAAAPGFGVRFTQLPDELLIGEDPTGMRVVAARDGGDCLKVRWSLAVQVSGVKLDDVRIDRVEEDGGFPVALQASGDFARFTDVDLDPGTLCGNRTVSAQYTVSIDEDATPGTVSLVAEAFDAQERLLERAAATRQVVSERGDSREANRKQRRERLQPSPEAASPSPSLSPTPLEPTEEFTPEPADSGAAGAGSTAAQPVQRASSQSSSGLGLIGIVVGALMIFLGGAVLMQIRRRAAATVAEPDDEFDTEDVDSRLRAVRAWQTDGRRRL